MLKTLLICALASDATAARDAQQMVHDHVQQEGNLTYKPASGELKFPYQVPGAFYQQLWDWDSMFMGVAMLEFGSAPYLEGSMKNFLDHTNSTGDVEGCLIPAGGTGTIYHAKPVVIQGAWIGAKNTGNVADFKPYKAQMEALLDYWDRTRRDEATGLYVWFDQLESGEDNLPISTCHSVRSPCWDPAIHSLVIAAPDLMTFLYREHQAYALFLKAWSSDSTIGAEEQAELSDASRRSYDRADDIKKALNDHLWAEDLGFYTSYNLSSRGPHRVTNRVGIMGFPLWAGLASKDQAAALVKQLWAEDMLSDWGIRSTR
jgi:neutral trehalase